MIFFSACYQIYQENIKARSCEKKTEKPVFSPTPDENEFVEEDDEDESSLSESNTVATFSDFPSEKSPNHFRKQQEEPRKTDTNNTSNRKSDVNVNTRLEYSLGLIESTFNDIFVAIEVNSSYQPTDVIEEERSRKRVKDFTCRIGRMLYQAKQNYITLKNAVTKAGFENKTTSHVDEKLAQLFVSSKNLLVSYLHFIPLSGGQMFPSIVSDVLDIILDIGNLTASLGFSTQNLSGNIRKLEQIISNQSDKRADSIGRDILNRLANNNNPRKAQHQPLKRIKSPRKTVMKQSVIKPKPNKIFQARTNLARMRRMESINETDSETTVSKNKYRNSDLERSEKQQISKTRSREREMSGNNVINVSENKCKAENFDMNVIKRRLHNLELLASTQDNKDHQLDEQSSIEPTQASDIKFLINRLEIMESDFDIMATKYNLNGSHTLFNSFKRSKKEPLHLEDIFPPQSTTRDVTRDSFMADGKKNVGSYSREVVETIVNRITDEMISQDLKF